MHLVAGHLRCWPWHLDNADGLSSLVLQFTPFISILFLADCRRFESNETKSLSISRCPCLAINMCILSSQAQRSPRVLFHSFTPTFFVCSLSPKLTRAHPSSPQTIPIHLGKIPVPSSSMEPTIDLSHASELLSLFVCLSSLTKHPVNTYAQRSAFSMLSRTTSWITLEPTTANP
jgi:hypothetical protein